MSDKSTHSAVGAVAGGLAALATARSENGWSFVAELAGGVVGGVHGARLPDILEPALHSHHRKFFHSMIAATGGTYVSVKHGPTPAAWLRQRAVELKERAAAESDPLRRLLVFLAAMACHFAIGYLVGGAAGYGSHLALDAASPRSLPVLGM
jgi:inner membrane protein